MLYTEENVRAGLRVREGKRVFFLGKEDRLTPSARDWLKAEGIEIRSGRETPPDTYTTLHGGSFSEKPEHMTHLAGNVLVMKSHPRIAFRGKVDAAEAEVLLCQKVSDQHPQLGKALQELLDFLRSLIRSDVLNEPVKAIRLCGLTDRELREHSHDPAKYYGQPHFMPSASDSLPLLHLNRLRTVLRELELSAYAAFSDREGLVTRTDILTACNRLSSLCWILMIRLKAGKL